MSGTPNRQLAPDWPLHLAMTFGRAISLIFGHARLRLASGTAETDVTLRLGPRDLHSVQRSASRVGATAVPFATTSGRFDALSEHKCAEAIGQWDGRHLVHRRRTDSGMARLLFPGLATESLACFSLAGAKRTA